MYVQYLNTSTAPFKNLGEVQEHGYLTDRTSCDDYLKMVFSEQFGFPVVDLSRKTAQLFFMPCMGKWDKAAEWSNCCPK